MGITFFRLKYSAILIKQEKSHICKSGSTAQLDGGCHSFPQLPVRRNSAKIFLCVCVFKKKCFAFTSPPRFLFLCRVGCFWKTFLINKDGVRCKGSGLHIKLPLKKIYCSACTQESGQLKFNRQANKSQWNARDVRLGLLICGIITILG